VRQILSNSVPAMCRKRGKVEGGPRIWKGRLHNAPPYLAPDKLERIIGLNPPPMFLEARARDRLQETVSMRRPPMTTNESSHA
jgi:hypothetical protein